MKDSVMCGIIVGMAIGAIAVTLYKPAQNVIKKGTEAIKEEAKSVIKKAKK